MDLFDRVIHAVLLLMVACVFYEIYEIIVGFNHLLKAW